MTEEDLLTELCEEVYLNRMVTVHWRTFKGIEKTATDIVDRLVVDLSSGRGDLLILFLRSGTRVEVKLDGHTSNLKLL